MVEGDGYKLVVAGGETSGSVVSALVPAALRIGREIVPEAYRIKDAGRLDQITVGGTARGSKSKMAGSGWRSGSG